MKKLVLVGGGHAHLEVLRQFGLRRAEDVAITLVSPDRYTPYSGMLPGLVAGHYTFDQCHIDLQFLAEYAGAQLVLARAQNLDASRRVLKLSDGNAIEYDVLSLNVGSVPLAQDVAGVAEHAIPVKPVADFIAAMHVLGARVGAGEIGTIGVVGGGAGGVEIVLALQHRFAQLHPRPDLEFSVITDAAQILPQHARGVRAVLERSLARKRITLHRALRVTRVEAHALTVVDARDDQQRIAADATLWVTGAAPPAWLANAGLALDENNFININKYLQSHSHPEVFAAGDCATIAGEVYPKSGVYAVRQGPVLAENLRRVLNGGNQSLLAYTPQKRALALISTGERHAIASWGPLSFHGNWVWRWKDSIDQAFMAKYRKTPQ